MNPIDQRSASDVRKNFKTVLDEVTLNRRPVVIKRQGTASDAMIVARDDYDALMETAYLFRSPANARRLLDAIERADNGDYSYASLEDFKRAVDAQAGDR